MIAARSALVAAFVAAGAVAQAQQPPDASDVTTSLRPAVMAYRQGDTATAERALRSLPSNADADAWLGAILLDRGAKAEGLKLIQRAADAGSAEGQHRLALIFANGDAGVPRNPARAVELFEKAAAQGHRRAQLNLGTIYLRGQGVQRDLIQARAWLEKAAADGGDVYATYALGRAMAENAPPASADPTRAADLFRRAAEKGHMFAALRYGMALADGSGVKQDLAAAQRWLVQAQQNGVPEAALALGDLAVRTPATRDKAANEKILKSAITWYQVAANAGVPSGQFKLANAYLAGSGMPRDTAQAQFWYGRAAQQGLPEAQQALGVMLLTGTAGQIDPVEAFKWLYLAERGGHAEARSVREKVGDKVPDRDRKRGEALAQAFKPVSELPLDEGPPRLVPVRR